MLWSNIRVPRKIGCAQETTHRGVLIGHMLVRMKRLVWQKRYTFLIRTHRSHRKMQFFMHTLFFWKRIARRSRIDRLNVTPKQQHVVLCTPFVSENSLELSSATINSVFEFQPVVFHTPKVNFRIFWTRRVSIVQQTFK